MNTNERFEIMTDRIGELKAHACSETYSAASVPKKLRFDQKYLMSFVCRHRLRHTGIVGFRISFELIREA